MLFFITKLIEFDLSTNINPLFLPAKNQKYAPGNKKTHLSSESSAAIQWIHLRLWGDADLTICNGNFVKTAISIVGYRRSTSSVDGLISF